MDVNLQNCWIIKKVGKLAVVADWSKTTVLQIQVVSGRLGPRFESCLGLGYQSLKIIEK